MRVLPVNNLTWTKLSKTNKEISQKVYRYCSFVHRHSLSTKFIARGSSTRLQERTNSQLRLGILDSCGNSQVRRQEVLLEAFNADASALDTSRFDVNTTATFYAALLVAIVYLYQGVTAKDEPRRA